MPYYCNTKKTTISDGLGKVGLDQVVYKLGLTPITRDGVEYVNIEDLLTTYCANEDRTLLKYFTKQVGTTQSALVFKGSSAADGDFGLATQEVRAQLDPGNTFSQQGVDLPAFTIKGGSPHFRQLARIEAAHGSLKFTRTKDKLTIGFSEFSKNDFSEGVIPTVFLVVLVGGGGGGGGGDHFNSGAGGGGGCTVIGTVSFLHMSEGCTYSIVVGFGGAGSPKYNTGLAGGASSIQHLRPSEDEDFHLSKMSANGGFGGESGSNTARQGGAGGQYSLELGDDTADANNQIFRIIDFISGGRGGDHNNSSLGVWPLADPYVSSCTTKNDTNKTLSFPKRSGGAANLSGAGGYSAYANGGNGGAAYSDGSPGTLGSGGGGGVYENFGGGYTGGNGGDGFVIIYY